MTSYAVNKDKFKIEHEGMGDSQQIAVVSCLDEATDAQAIDFITAKRGGTWLMSLKWAKNPAWIEEKQFWAWLLVKV